MSVHLSGPGDRDPALAFGRVAGEYHRARPSYPSEAAAWLTPGTPARVLELGAGTGKLTAELAALGQHVVATDPSEPMLRRLAADLPGVPVALATAEQIPVASRSVDAVVAGQAFHWFDLDRSLPEIARVLRPGGTIGLVWNLRDERIPWVKRLGSIIGTPEQQTDPTAALVRSCLFGFVETATFRFWQPLNRESLHDLVSSRSRVAMMGSVERDRVLRRVDDLYESYGRGADGMLLPYVTRCFRASLTASPPVGAEAGADTGAAPHQGRSAPGGPVGPDDVDTDALLIDFR